jgi:hypothetical protein
VIEGPPQAALPLLWPKCSTWNKCPVVPLNPKQKKYLDAFFPGLIQAVEALGAGDFVSKPPDLKAVGDEHIRAVESLYLEYKFSDGMTLEIRSTMHLKKGAPPYRPNMPLDIAHWDRTGYALHYGKTYEGCLFRFDLDGFSGYHIHLRPTPKLHRPATDFTPDTRNLAPIEFVKWVKKFRADNIDPVRRKKT